MYDDLPIEDGVSTEVETGYQELESMDPPTCLIIPSDTV